MTSGLPLPSRREFKVVGILFKIKIKRAQPIVKARIRPFLLLSCPAIDPHPLEWLQQRLNRPPLEWPIRCLTPP